MSYALLTEKTHQGKNSNYRRRHQGKPSVSRGRRWGKYNRHYDGASDVSMFKNGAITGAFSRLFNDELHRGQEDEAWINTELTVSEALDPANWPTLPDEVVDAVAGFGDSLSFNLTKHFRNWADIGSVALDSISYVYGNTTGTVFGLANAGRAGFQVYKGVNKAKLWRSNSRAARRTRARKIAAAGSYRPSAADAALTIIGGSGVDSYFSLLKDNQ